MRNVFNSATTPIVILALAAGTSVAVAQLAGTPKVVEPDGGLYPGRGSRPPRADGAVPSGPPATPWNNAEKNREMAEYCDEFREYDLEDGRPTDAGRWREGMVVHEQQAEDCDKNPNP